MVSNNNGYNSNCFNCHRRIKDGVLKMKNKNKNEYFIVKDGKPINIFDKPQKEEKAVKDEDNRQSKHR